ncbi:MAG: type II toxin-antitoxin system VapC family toxin, partial [Terriglobia bacterium]
MADPPKRVCWDACAWIGFVSQEPDKIQPLRMIWDAAQRGGYEIWTSTYAYLEVLKAKDENGDPIPVEESNRIIDEMFQQPHVRRVQLDVEVARMARDLKNRYHVEGLRKRSDAIYLATALYYNLDELHTWDRRDLLPFDQKIKRRDGKPLRIIIPGSEVAGPLFAAQPTTPASDAVEIEPIEAASDGQPID